MGTVSLSKEARVGIWVGIVVGILLVLLDPKQLLVRGALWLAVGISLVLIATDLNWVKERSWNLNILEETGVSQEFSVLRFFFAILIISFLVSILAVTTWPPVELQDRLYPMPLVFEPPMYTEPPSNPTFFPNSDKKLIPPAPARSPKAHPATPSNTPVPKPMPSSHPIIVASGSQVTQDTTTREIKITITLINTSTVGVNVHLVSDIRSNGEPIPGSIDTREVAFAPSPFNFILHFDATPNPQQQIGFIGGTNKLAVIINATYSDEGGQTTYKYEGDVVPNGSSLDDRSSMWTKDTARK